MGIFQSSASVPGRRCRADAEAEAEAGMEVLLPLGFCSTLCLPASSTSVPRALLRADLVWQGPATLRAVSSKMSA